MEMDIELVLNALVTLGAEGAMKDERERERERERDYNYLNCSMDLISYSLHCIQSG